LKYEIGKEKIRRMKEKKKRKMKKREKNKKKTIHVNLGRSFTVYMVKNEINPVGLVVLLIKFQQNLLLLS